MRPFQQGHGSRIFLHLGAYKTATTFLQHNLKRNREVLATQNWRDVKLHADHKDIMANIRRMRGKDTLRRGTDSLTDSYFDEIRNEKTNIILTCEALLGRMSIRGNGLFADYARNMNFIKSQLEGCDVTVGFCVRDFADYAESSYKFILMGGADYDFETYIRGISANDFSWLAMIESMANIFGSENLLLWTYEDFRKDTVESLKRILAAASIDPSAMDFAPNPKNVSLRPDVLPLTMQWHQLLKSHTNLPRAAEVGLRRALRRILSKPARGDKSILTARQLGVLQSLYQGKIERLRSSGNNKRAIKLTQEFLAEEHRPSAMPLLSPEFREELRARYQQELAVIRSRWPKQFLSLGG